MTVEDVRRLLAVCEAADDQDTGSLDAFREAATVGVVAELCREVLSTDETFDQLADAVFFLYQRAMVNKTVAVGTSTVE